MHQAFRRWCWPGHRWRHRLVICFAQCMSVNRLNAFSKSTLTYRVRGSFLNQRLCVNAFWGMRCRIILVGIRLRFAARFNQRLLGIIHLLRKARYILLNRSEISTEQGQPNIWHHVLTTKRAMQSWRFFFWSPASWPQETYALQCFNRTNSLHR